MRDAIGPALRAAGITAGVAALAYLLVRPPSFTGARGLALLLAGAGLAFYAARRRRP